MRFTDVSPASPGGGTLTNPGHYNGGSIHVDGIATAPAELEFLGPAVNAASTGIITGHDSALRFTGGLSNFGSVALTRGANDVSGDITNNVGGTLTVTGGASAVFYDDVTQNGTLRVAKVGGTSSTAVFLGGYSGGGATGGGDIFLEGDLRPGASPASVTFGNNVSLGAGAVTHIELAGTTVGKQYDKINVTGAVNLDGDLVVSLLGGFNPTAGNTFDVLDWASLSGTFDSLTLPTLGSGLTWNASQLYTTGVLSVSGISGDNDLDGDVDGHDFLVWQRGGSPSPLSSADLAA